MNLKYFDTAKNYFPKLCIFSLYNFRYGITAWGGTTILSMAIINSLHTLINCSYFYNTNTIFLTLALFSMNVQ